MLASHLGLALYMALSGPPGEEGGTTETAFVAIMPIQGAQEIPPTRKEMIESTVASQFEDPALVILDTARTGQALTDLGSCGTATQCQVKLAQKLSAQYLVRIQVDEPKTSDFNVRLELVDGADGTVVKSFADTCEICSEADLKRLAQEHALDLQNVLLRRLRGEEEEEVEEPVAVVPVAPPEPEKIVIVERVPPPPILSAGYALLGVGSAATAGGIVLLALTGQSAGCPADPRGGPCIPIVYKTAIPGAIVGGIGVAVLAAGIGMVVAGKKKQKQKEKSGENALVPKFGVGVGAVTVSGRF